MGKIDELIKELCPDGVEYRTLSDLGTFYGGLSGKSKKDFTDGNAKFISYMNIFSNPSVNLDIEDSVVINENEKQNSIQYKDVLFTGSSETPDECGMSSVVTEELREPFYLNSFSFGFRLTNKSLFDKHFLKHYFRGYECRKAIAKTANGVTRFNISKTKFGKIQIPLPPLSIQQQIVEILDTFTDSISNLQEELELREKQMEYYRERLFNVNAHQYKVVKLSEVATYSKLKINASSINKYNYVSVENLLQNKGGKVESTCCPNEGNWTKFLPKDILIGNIRPYLKKIWFANCEGGTNGDVLDIRVCNDILSPEFLFKVLSSDNFFAYNTQNAAGAKMPRGNKKAVMKYSLPIPPQNEQQEIVDILDTFESMIANIKEEIELRQKQYEYYREKLLTFERKGA